MGLVCKLGVNPLHVMVVHKIIQLQSVRTIASHLVETSYSVGNLKIIMVIVP